MLTPIPVNGGTVNLFYDPQKWGAPEVDSKGIITLDYLPDDGYAAIIAETVGAPSDLVLDQVLEDVAKKHSDLKIPLREKRTVNGREISCAKCSLTWNEIPMILYLYCFGGLAGTVQIRTCSSAARFDQSEPDFNELLNSLRVEPLKHPLLTRMRQLLRFEGYVAVAASPALGVALFRFGDHMTWQYALLWTAVLAVAVFIAGWFHARKWRLK